MTLALEALFSFFVVVCLFHFGTVYEHLFTLISRGGMGHFTIFIQVKVHNEIQKSFEILTLCNIFLNIAM